MEQKYNCTLGILFDLQGPKLRIGTFKDYYATLTGTPATDENLVTIATATVTGNGTMDCAYKLNASISGTYNMFNAFGSVVVNRCQTRAKRST